MHHFRSADMFEWSAAHCNKFWTEDNWHEAWRTGSLGYIDAFAPWHLYMDIATLDCALSISPWPEMFPTFNMPSSDVLQLSGWPAGLFCLNVWRAKSMQIRMSTFSLPQQMTDCKKYTTLIYLLIYIPTKAHTIACLTNSTMLLPEEKLFSWCLTLLFAGHHVFCLVKVRPTCVLSWRKERRENNLHVLFH